MAPVEVPSAEAVAAPNPRAGTKRSFDEACATGGVACVKCVRAGVANGGHQCRLSFDDGSTWLFHSAWLRDTLRSIVDDGWHRDILLSPLTAPVVAAGKAGADTTGVMHEAVVATAARPDKGGAEVSLAFGPDGHEEAYPARFLRAYAELVAKLEEGESRRAGVVRPTTWLSDAPTPEFEYAAIEADPAEQERWVSAVFNHGMAHVHGCPDDDGATGDVLHATMQKWIGRLQNHPERVTAHWKITTAENHATRIKDAPYNTSLRLLQHTDQTAYAAPGVLLTFHCVAGKGTNPVCDGFAVAEHLREHRPDLFEALSEQNTGWGRRVNFYDNQIDQHCKGKVITLDEEGNIRMIRWNEINRGIVDVPFEQFPKYWEALQEWIKLVHSDKFIKEVQVTKGDMITFNNWRCLHGRKALSATSGRVMVGGTIDKGAVKSRLRLNANRAANPEGWDEKFDNAVPEAVLASMQDRPFNIWAD